MIIIVQELEFDEVRLGEAVASILGLASGLAGSADPGDEAPPKNKKIARTEAKHTNLTTRLNVPSGHPGQGAPSCLDLFSQKILFHKNTCFPNLTTRLSVPSSHPGQDASSHRAPPMLAASGRPVYPVRVLSVP